MAVFAWRALDAGGRQAVGVIDADGRQGAWEALRARGLYPTTLAEQADGGTRGRVPAVERAATLRELALLAAAGVPVAEALDDAAASAGHPALLAALARARTEVRAGRPLADALAASPRVFPPLVHDLVRAGEAAGALPTVLARLAEHAERAAALQARLRAALAYPAVMATATCGVLGVLIAWVLPRMASLFAESGAPMPLASRVLLSGGTLVARTAWLWMLVAGGGAVALRSALATPAGRARRDALALRVPAVGRLVGRAAHARAARTLATVLASGVRLEHGLELAAAAAGNVVVGRAYAAARDAVREGARLAPSLATAPALPASVARLVDAGERTGTLAAACDHAAGALEAEVERGVAAATALVEPALVLVMGAAVLLLVLAVLVPLLSFDPTAGGTR